MNFLSNCSVSLFRRERLKFRAKIVKNEEEYLDISMSFEQFVAGISISQQNTEILNSYLAIFCSLVTKFSTYKEYVSNYALYIYFCLSLDFYQF